MKASKYILAVSFFSFLISFAPVGAYAELEEALTGVENLADAQEIKISINSNTDGQDVRVRDAEGLKLEIYNVIGVRVAVYRIDSNDKTFSISFPKGCYLLKVGKVVRKTFIR